MHKVISKDGTTIAYEKKGEGPILILVLGALNKRGSGKKLVQLLKEDFTVVSYDRRGRGDSSDTAPYSTNKEVDDIEALIDELGGKAYLYGHSSGAILAMLAAKGLKDKVKGLALYEVPFNEDPNAQQEAKAYRKELLQALANDERGEAVSLFVKSVGVTDNQIAAMRRLPLWKGLTAMVPTLAYDTVHLMEQYPKLDTRQIETSCLVMYGGASSMFMADTAQKLSQTLPHVTLRPLKDQTHDVKAEALAPVLSKFFSNLSD